MATSLASPVSHGLSVRSPLAAVIAWFAERRQRGAVLRELHQYTSRDLADLGITQGDFTAIAAGTFRRG